MKKYLSKLAIGSALCASSMAFAAEPASLVLSDQQMDSVTAGNMGHQLPPQASSRSASSQTISQTQSTRNVSISPTVGVNVSVFGSGTQSVGSSTYQSGGTQTATNR